MLIAGERGSRKHGSEHNEPPQKSEAARTPVGQQHISEVWKLRLGLIKAQHLPKKHFHSGHVSSALMGTPDPFVTFEIPGQQQQKSKAITNSLNPVWNEEFVFDVHDEKQELVLKVFDLHEVTKNDLVGDLIGEVRLKLSELSSFLNTKSSTRTFNIMNATPGHAQQGRPVIGNDSETATVTLLLSASNKESAHGLGDEEADLYYVQQQEALLLKQVLKFTCFTSTTVQILPQLLMMSVCSTSSCEHKKSFSSKSSTSSSTQLHRCQLYSCICQESKSNKTKN